MSMFQINYHIDFIFIDKKTGVYFKKINYYLWRLIETHNLLILVTLPAANKAVFSATMNVSKSKIYRNLKRYSNL